MALAELLQRRIQARKEHDLESGIEQVSEDSDESDETENDPSSDLEKGNDNELSGTEGEADSLYSDSSLPPDPKETLSSISFGALAAAQASLAGERKRKRSPNEPSNLSEKRAHARTRSLSPFHEAAERLAGKKASNLPQTSRSSKHAPTELSSKKAVSRKRTVVVVPAAKPRDPRFSAASGPLDAQRVARDYSFLAAYRTAETEALRERMRGTKDAGAREELKRELRGMADRESARSRELEQREVVREHRRRERDLVSAGKKPFFLKSAEVRKQALVKRFEGLDEKAAEKAMAKRRKRKAGKERKALPMGRRHLEDGGA